MVKVGVRVKTCFFSRTVDLGAYPTRQNHDYHSQNEIKYNKSCVMVKVVLIDHRYSKQFSLGPETN